MGMQHIQAKTTVFTKKSKMIKNSKIDSSKYELIAALKSTIEAQKGTIEAMKVQNAQLKERQSSIFSEIDDLSKKEFNEIKQIMSIYITGLRKL
ncbi:hypothetical protein KKA14_09655 [bacterium]|nr:hypothetical protein [bacterium]